MRSAILALFVLVTSPSASGGSDRVLGPLSLKRVAAFTADDISVPLHFEVDSRRQLWVADLDFRAVRAFDRRGRLRQSLGGKRVDAGRLGIPIGFAVRSDGAIWVSDFRGNHLKEYAADGDYRRTVCELAGWEVLPASRGEFILADFSEHDGRYFGITRYSEDCEVVWRSAEVSPSRLLLLHLYGLNDGALVRGSNGLLYHTAAHTMEIVVVDDNGKEERRIPLPRGGPVPPATANSDDAITESGAVPAWQSSQRPSQEEIEATRNQWSYIRRLLQPEAGVLLPVYLGPKRVGDQHLRWGFDIVSDSGFIFEQGLESELQPIAANSDGSVLFLSGVGTTTRCPCELYEGRLKRDWKRRAER